MASYSTNEFKSGLKIMIDNDPCAIIENEFVKPGKGQAFNRVKIRNLKNGRVIERTYKSGESVEAADVMDVDLQYLYNDGDLYYFMDEENFEQMALKRPGRRQARLKRVLQLAKPECVSASASQPCLSLRFLLHRPEY